METTKRYRHEWKHAISYADLLSIRSRLRAVADLDPHASGGSYTIRSLYFDSPTDRALRQKVDGVDMREKFRIRCYNNDLSFIQLEKKSKLRNLGTKYHARLTPEQVDGIVQGDLSWMMGTDDALIQELYCKMHYQQLRPKTIVEYTREPYVYAPGNVRVTFDYDLRTGMGSTDFLNAGCTLVPAGDAPILLEVKWDDFLPSIIRDCVQTPGRRVTAFSKYAQCRIYG